MSDQNSIFKDQTSQETPASQTTSQAPASDLNDLLSSIKNERGEPKYRTIEDAIKALSHSQTYIPELSTKVKQQEQEISELRMAATKVSELERVVKALTEQETQTKTPEVNALTPDKVTELVSQVIQANKASETHQSNLSLVVNTMKTAFGDDASKVFYEKAASVGMTVDQINALAASTPKAVFKLLGIDEQKAKPLSAPFNTTINTAGFTPASESFIKRNAEEIPIGASSQYVLEEAHRSRKLVDELHAQGKSVHDLTDPKVYFKYFR